MNEHYLEHPTHSQFHEDMFKVLRLLSSQEDLSQRDISTHINISLGKTNYLLKGLLKGGLIKITNFARESQRLKKMGYVLTKKGFRTQLQLTHHFLRLKEKEYLDLKKEAETMANHYGE